MRKLGMVILIAVLGWSAYWYLGKTGAEKLAETWLEDRRGEGWQAEAASIRTGGFPYRFDTTLSDLALADPGTGWAWSAPRFQVLSLAYQPTHFIAIWPEQHKISTPYETITLASSEMRASAVFAPDTDLTLRRSTLALNALTLTSDAGWSADLDSGVLAAEQDEDDPLSYKLGFAADGVRPAKAVKVLLDPAGVLPDVFESLKIDAKARFDTPWDRHALEDRRPQITALDLGLLQATWGKLDLRAAGQVSVDANGTPEGEITIKATNWREILQILVDSGALPQGLLPAAEATGERLAALSGNKNTLDVPLTFSGGRVFFGPIPIGAAPDLTLR